MPDSVFDDEPGHVSVLLWEPERPTADVAFAIEYFQHIRGEKPFGAHPRDWPSSPLHKDHF